MEMEAKDGRIHQSPTDHETNPPSNLFFGLSVGLYLRILLKLWVSQVLSFLVKTVVPSSHEENESINVSKPITERPLG